MSTMSVSLALRTSAFYFKSMGFVAHPFHLHAMWIGCKRNAGLPENLDRLARFSQPKHDAEQQRLGFRQCLRVKPVQMGEHLLQARRERGMKCLQFGIGKLLPLTVALKIGRAHV